MQIATQAWSNGEWWIAVSLAVGFFVFIFWIIMTALETREEALRRETREIVYEKFACTQCGNYTVWRSTDWAICVCCGMKVEIDDGKEC